MRNTILLQIGLLNDGFKMLNMWLSNYNLSNVISELINKESPNYSKEFSEGWRALRRFRDHILTRSQASDLLKQNIWFKHLDIEELLSKAISKQRGQRFSVFQDENLPIFFLEQIHYDNKDIKFVLNAQDLYSLNLSGYRYDIQVNGEYKGVLIANSAKKLVLEEPVSIVNPQTKQISLELVNEDSDSVYSTEITLFDYNDQLVLFDEDGTIYQDIFKKLNKRKKYHLLIDSDLDCNFNKNLQREFFDGEATLVPFISYEDDCILTYEDEEVFRLNFTENIKKPDFIDKMVLYTSTTDSFVLDKEYDFNLKIFEINSDTYEDTLAEIPDEAEIIKWSYSGGYADKDEISNGTIRTKLYPEMMTFPKHVLMIKYQKRVYKKVLYCHFFEKNNRFRLFRISQNGESELVENGALLNKRDLKKYTYFLADYSRKHDHLYVKSKSKVYQNIKPNRIIRFKEFDGFGEYIFVSENIFHTRLFEVFNYSNCGEYISLSNEGKSIFFHKELPDNAKLIVLDSDLEYHEFIYERDESGVQEVFPLGFEAICCLATYGNSIFDSCYKKDFLKNYTGSKHNRVAKNLLLSNYPFLLKRQHKIFLKTTILYDPEGFIDLFCANRIALNKNLFQHDFSKFGSLLDDILLGVKFDQQTSEKILKNIILEKRQDLILEAPITLFGLILSAESSMITKFFYQLVRSAELKNERDENFVDDIVDSLLNPGNLSGMKKQNVKIAMHYLNGKYYLKKALEAING